MGRVEVKDNFGEQRLVQERSLERWGVRIQAIVGLILYSMWVRRAVSQ